MRKFNLLQFASIVIFSFLLFSFDANGQRRINGTVRDAVTNSPLEGATVSVKNQKTNVITNESGKFQITIPNDKTTLIITFVGYQQKSAAVGEKETSILISLDKSSTSLDDVVIVGVQSQTKRTTTSAVSTVLSVNSGQTDPPSPFQTDPLKNDFKKALKKSG